MTSPRSPAAAAEQQRWHQPVDPRRCDTSTTVRAVEVTAIRELGVEGLRRLRCRDSHASGWERVGRLLQPLEAVNAALDSPPTPHRRRAMDDAVAVILQRCADVGRSYWGWTSGEWTQLLGADQAAFRAGAPAWADEAVRPYLAAHAYLLGGFNEFHRLGSFSRLTLAWRIFGRERVNVGIHRVRAVLAGWGYRLGSDDDKLLPMVACQVFLLNRSPHLEELDTGLFDRIRGEQLLVGTRLNTLHAMQRAVAALGFCDPPSPGHRRRTAQAAGGPQVWVQWVERWYATSTLTPACAAASAPTCSRSAGGWPPSISRPATRRHGPGGPAPPGSPRSTG